MSGSISSRWTKPCAPRCIPSCSLALAQERRADVADAHRLGDFRAPALLELRAERRLAAAGLAGDEDALDARARANRGSRQIRGVRRGEHDGLGLQRLDRADQELRVAGADRDVHEPDPLERRKRRACDERAGVVRRDDPLSGLDSRRRIAARRAGQPVLDVARCERDVARRAGRAARRVDADDLGRLRAEVRAERALGRDRVAQLVLLGQRQLGEVLEPVAGARAELLAVEGRALEEVGELGPVALGVSARTRPPLPPSSPGPSRSALPAPRRGARGDSPCARGSGPPSPPRRDSRRRA